MPRGLVSFLLVVVIVVLVSTNGTVATSASPQGPLLRKGRQAGAGARGGPQSSAVPVAYEDYTGFTRLWDGRTFTNWDGETDVWSIKAGAIHSDTTKTPGQHHIHYTGPGAVMRDFDLKVEVKLSATGANGGIQYRSRLLHAARGGSITDPLGKPLPAGVTTLEQAVAAGTPPHRARGEAVAESLPDEVAGLAAERRQSASGRLATRTRRSRRRVAMPESPAQLPRATLGKSAGISLIWTPTTSTPASCTQVRGAAS